MSSAGKKQRGELTVEYMVGLARTLSLVHWRSQLETPEIASFVKQRGLNESTLKTFQIGGAGSNNGLCRSFQTRAAVTGARHLGFVRETEGGRAYDFFKDRLVFPIFNKEGTLIGAGGRAIPGMQDQDTPKYLNGPNTDFFDKSENLYGMYENQDGIRKTRSAIVVEGYMDVLSLHQAGFKNAVAPLGTAFGDKQFKMLVDQGASHIHFCFDSDKAGTDAALKAAKIAMANAIPSSRITFVDLKGLDPDDYIKQHGAASFQDRLDVAKTPAEFLHDNFWTPKAAHCDMEMANYIHQWNDYILEANSFQRPALLERVGTVSGLGDEVSVYDASGMEVDVRSSEKIVFTEEQINAGRLLMHGQLPPHIEQQVMAAMPEVTEALNDPLSTISLVGDIQGPVPTQLIGEALANMNVAAGLGNLEQALAEFREEPTEEVRDKVRSTLVLG